MFFYLRIQILLSYLNQSCSFDFKNVVLVFLWKKSVTTNSTELNLNLKQRYKWYRCEKGKLLLKCRIKSILCHQSLYFSPSCLFAGVTTYNIIPPVPLLLPFLFICRRNYIKYYTTSPFTSPLLVY